MPDYSENDEIERHRKRKHNRGDAGGDGQAEHAQIREPEF